MCPPWLGCCVRLAELVSSLPICLTWLCLSPWLGCCVRLAGLVCQFVSHLALSFTLGGVLCPPRLLSPNLSPNLPPTCLSPWLGCCVRLAGLVSQFVFHIGFVFHLGWGAVSASLGLSLVLSPNLSPIWLCLSPWLGCCVRLAELVSQFVSHLALSFALAGVLCPPRWACLPICFPSHLASSFTLAGVVCPSGFVFHLGWGAVSAALGLSPNLSSIWLCLSPWLGCCVRLAGLVSQFVSHLAVSQFSLAICFPSGFVFHLGWGAVSASLGLSPNLFPTWLCLSPWLGCCVRLAGLVSQFVSHPIWLCLSPWLVGVLCPPRWACLWSCLPICLLSGFVSQFCLPSGFVFHLGWGAVSASLGLSGLVFQFVAQFVFYLALSPSFVSPFVSHLALSFTLAGVLCPPRWACLRSPIWLCLPVLPPHFSPI